MFQDVAPIRHNESLATNLRRIWRFGLRTLGHGGAALGSYAVVPLDHRAVLSATDPEFAYGEVLARIRAQETVYDTLLRRMSHAMDLARETIARGATDERQPFWNNSYFQGNDASALWALTGLLRPSRIVEIGSGNSTKFFRHSIEHHGLDTRLVCIDPAPRTEISSVADEVHYTPVQHASPDVFGALQPGDVLFFDGSHLVVQGSDTQFVFLEILPRLPRGVLVHIHDVNLPYEYRRFYNSRLYGEQYLLAALLIFSPDWKPVLPVYWLEKTGRLMVPDSPGASLWLTNDLDFLLKRIAVPGQ
ncbi:class I SAM-dependent methyltransferase [Bradyrhizobium sp.]|uniref:class I SAM-dependent methyltransferase n=1 Tax=Bradyrhizobium sp. TaxID=376 RepID=UPI001ECBE5C6|nr:class I SAM-dependent methyltransferase [Bradyrhizobium sp.]MBV8922237.1 class I SAM-dependent methyltransferase [Bradyrhizobium sp.]MBV9981045.1 class I SAM-dependent methyltransferase [Bradyrhizobium sp.]